jgi:lipopolysaccharide assembly protein A
MMRIVVWLFRALIFFSLFAFALNNQQVVSVNWFFGFESRAPMVFIVLAAFAVGCALGVFAMVPSWWRHRRVAKQQRKAASAPPAPPDSLAHGANSAVLEHPPRDGL